MSVEVLDRHLCELGEGPTWDERSGEVAWVDILGGVVHLLDLATSGRRSVATGVAVGAVVPRRATAGGWLAWLEDGPALLADDGAVTRLASFADADGTVLGAPVRANDAKCDPSGRCLGGTMSYDNASPVACLYRLDPGGASLVPLLGGLTVSNGLAWSADGGTMYFIDTPTGRIDAFSYDLERGAIGDRRTVVEISEPTMWPDGMTIDADGCLWVALWGGGAIRRYTPDGRLDRVIELPCTNVTSCTFVGAALDRLVITTAWHVLPEPEELAGATFIADPGVIGTPTVPFAG